MGPPGRQESQSVTFTREQAT